MGTLVIDADSIVYKACFVTERTVYDAVPKSKESLETYEEYKPFVIQSFRYAKEFKEWLGQQKDPDKFVRKSRKEYEPLPNTLKIVNDMFHEIIRNVQPDQVAVFLTGDNNFREDIAFIREYKLSRKDKPKPRDYHAVRDHIIKYWDGVLTNGYEADDAVTMVSEACREDEQICIIATIDKDLMTVPGWKYNYDTKEFTFVSDLEAAYNFYYQLLVGDKSDDIIGVPGIGPVAAKKLLEPCKTAYDMYRVCSDAYYKAFAPQNEKVNAKFGRQVSEKILRENAHLLHMLRYPLEMWEPPEPAKAAA